MTDLPSKNFAGGNPPENYERFFVPVIGEPLAKDLIKLAEIQVGEKVLDVACGTGVVTRLAAKQVGVTGLVVGIDINPGMLEVANSVTPQEMVIEWREANIEKIPFPADSFDIVLCQMGLQLIHDKLAALKEIRRVLRSGGRFIFNLPGPTPQLFVYMQEAFEKTVHEKFEFLQQVFSLHDESDIRKLVSAAGFRDISIQSNTKLLHLPPPNEFLWQYVFSTPLAMLVSQLDAQQRTLIENDIVTKWQKYIMNGGMEFQVRMTNGISWK